MTKETSLPKQDKVIYEIIKNTNDLPPDRQEVVLMIAKSMKYTRECVIRECNKEKY